MRKALRLTVNRQETLSTPERQRNTPKLKRIIDCYKTILFTDNDLFGNRLLTVGPAKQVHTIVKRAEVKYL